MYNDSDRPAQAPGFKASYFDGEVILYNASHSNALCLNETAALVWSLCDGTNSVADIQQTLSDAFDDAKNISQDVNAALEQLQVKKCIQLNAD